MKWKEVADMHDQVVAKSLVDGTHKKDDEDIVESNKVMAQLRANPEKMEQEVPFEKVLQYRSAFAAIMR